MERAELVQIVSENIQLVMAEKGLTAAEVARRAKLNPTGVYDIMSGKSRSPRVDTIQKIAAALGVSAISLFERRTDQEMRQRLAEVFERLPADEQERLLATARAWAELRAAS